MILGLLIGALVGYILCLKFHEPGEQQEALEITEMDDGFDEMWKRGHRVGYQKGLKDRVK